MKFGAIFLVLNSHWTTCKIAGNVSIWIKSQNVSRKITECKPAIFIFDYEYVKDENSCDFGI